MSDDNELELNVKCFAQEVRFSRSDAFPGRPVRGFSLIELMFTIAILAISVGIAVPYLSNAVQRSRLETVSEEYVNAFIAARNTAIARSAATFICPIVADLEAPAACGAPSDWINGYIMYSKNASSSGLSGFSPFDAETDNLEFQYRFSSSVSSSVEVSVFASGFNGVGFSNEGWLVRGDSEFPTTEPFMSVCDSTSGSGGAQYFLNASGNLTTRRIKFNRMNSSCSESVSPGGV